MFYQKNKDEAFIVSIDKFQYNILNSERSLFNNVNSWTYAECVAKSLGEIDARFNNISSRFKNEIFIRSISAEFDSANMKNNSKTVLIFPTYRNILIAMDLFSIILEEKPENAAEHSIMAEVKFYKEEVLKITYPIFDDKAALEREYEYEYDPVNFLFKKQKDAS